MKIKHLLLVIICTTVGFLRLDAQAYKSAVGLRLGYPWSLSYKHFISENGAIEAILGFRGYSYYSWINVGAFYEHHKPISSVEGLAWYLGGGVNLYKWTYDSKYYPNNDYNSVSFGISGVIGLDYKFADIPLNLSVDWIPTVLIGGDFNNGFGGGYGGLAARYILGGKKK